MNKGNVFIEYYLNLIKVAFNERTVGSVLLDGNQLSRMRLLQPTAVVASHAFTFPNQTTPLILLANVTEVRLRNERYAHLDLFKVLNVKNAQLYQMTQCSFEDIRTPQICSA